MGLGHIVSLVSCMQKSQMLLKRYHWLGAERPGDWTWGVGGNLPTVTILEFH